MSWFRRNIKSKVYNEYDDLSLPTASSQEYRSKKELSTCTLCGAYLECAHCGSTSFKNGRCVSCGAPQK
jgi:hypothetical protein